MNVIVVDLPRPALGALLVIATLGAVVSVPAGVVPPPPPPPALAAAAVPAPAAAAFKKLNPVVAAVKLLSSKASPTGLPPNT